MADVTVTLPVITQTAAPQAPTVNAPNVTLVLSTIARKAKVRRGPRTS
jgi:hypothetical protein